MSEELTTVETEEQEEQLAVIPLTEVQAMAKSEVESQLDAAHKYPRRLAGFMTDALAMVSRSVDVASACFYSLPRDGKQIMGPSVRLAEIAAACYGNMHFGARPLEVGPDDKVAKAQGFAWDVQKNVRVTVEKSRRITSRDGRRYSDDMVVVTQNAAASIALRDAVFRVIPRAFVNELYDRARAVAVGPDKAITERRTEVFKKLNQFGATNDRILAALGRDDISAVTRDDLESLIGLGTSIKERQTTVDEAFPEIQKAIPAEDQGKRLSLKSKKQDAGERQPGEEG